MPKRVATGRVTSAAASKTRRVEVPRIVRHPKYGRILHRRTVCHVHDEQEASAPGDLVEIIECRPRSRTKRWELVRVVAKSTAVDVASLRSGARATSIKETAARTEEAAATGEEARTGGADSAGAGEEATT
jgi:small subunit ribosomal protein S17